MEDPDLEWWCEDEGVEETRREEVEEERREEERVVADEEEEEAVEGVTVESWSWMSIMWSPRRMVRLRGAFPDRKSFT